MRQLLIWNEIWNKILFSKVSPLPEFCFGKLQHEVRIKMLILIRVLPIYSYMIWSRTGIFGATSSWKNPLHGGNFSFFFCLPDYPEEKAGPKKPQKNRKRSIENLQRAKGKSRKILAHSFTLKTLDLWGSSQTKPFHDSVILWFCGILYLCI